MVVAGKKEPMKVFAFAAAMAALFPAAAAAEPFDGPYIGAQVGYHEVTNFVKGAVFGPYIGFNAPVGERLVLGLEAEGNLGTGNNYVLEYGAHAHAGLRVSNALVSARLGYLRVHDDQDEDDSGRHDGLMVGLGAEVPLNKSFSIRGTLDTLRFDTVRIAAGISLHF